MTAAECVETVQAALVAGDDRPHPLVKHTEIRVPQVGEYLVVVESHVAHQRGPHWDPKNMRPMTDPASMSRSSLGNHHEVLEIRQGQVPHDEQSRQRVSGTAHSVRLACKAKVNFARVPGRIQYAWVTVWERYGRVTRKGEYYDMVLIIGYPIQSPMRMLSPTAQ